MFGLLEFGFYLILFRLLLGVTGKLLKYLRTTYMQRNDC